MLSRFSFLLLLIIILLESLCGHAESPGKLQKPVISVDAVQNTGVVNISCQTKLRNPTLVTNISCNLYIGDSSEKFRRTWTTSKPVCNFEVNVSDLQKSREVSCDYSVNTDPRSPSPRSKKANIVGKLPKAELELSPAVISIKDSMNLRCRRPDSSPASHCTFTIDQRGPINGSDCERSVTGAELLSGSHSTRNEIIMRCVYRLDRGPALHSDTSKVTVLDLRKPNISVSTEHTETHICCEAPPDITGAIFFLYSNRSRIHSKSTQAGTEERAVSFTVPRSSDSTLTYCCRYQFKAINSKLSDCAEAKNKDQSKTWLKTPAGIGVILTVIVILLGMTGACLYWIHRKRKSSGLPTTPNNDAVYTTVNVSKGAETSDATSPSDVTYSTVAHLAPQTTAFQAQQDNVVYSSLKTD
ncbi:uncharacterized protein LOC135240051 isoform X3 [Anguilla rostrata]|uniref:uncharacterized protein LOC135240051 isoform X3 n=1 Tax=Anguilla rostrata TaxID=7938 RepID=UPI0030D09815